VPTAPRTYHHDQQLDIFALLVNPLEALEGNGLSHAPAVVAVLEAAHVAAEPAAEPTAEPAARAKIRATIAAVLAEVPATTLSTVTDDEEEEEQPVTGVLDDPEASDEPEEAAAPDEPPSVFVKPSSPTWMEDAIRAYKGGDEAALTPVVDYYRRVFRRDARAMNVASNFRSVLDPTDVESAGMEQLVVALDGFEPDAGTPFQGFFKKYRKAAVRSEKAAYMGPMRLSRRTLTERGQVFHAVDAVRAEMRANVGATPLQVRRIRFTLSPAQFSDADARAILHGTRGERRQAIARLVSALATYFTEVLTTTRPVSIQTPDGPQTVEVTVRPDDAQVRRLAGAPLGGAQPLNWKPTRAEIEAMLALNLITFLERLARNGEQVALRYTADDPVFIAAVASKAGISEAQVRLHLRLDVHGTSLNEPVNGKDGKDAGSVGDRIGTPEADVTGDVVRAKAAVAIRYMPLGAEMIFVMMMGLNGEPPMSQDEIGLALGLLSSEVDLYVRQVVDTLRHPAVVERLHGTYAGQAARRALAAEDLLAVVQAWPADPDAVEAQTQRAVRATAALATPQQDIFAAPAPEAPTARVGAVTPPGTSSLLTSPSYTYIRAATTAPYGPLPPELC
jgi:hypothetical protein